MQDKKELKADTEADVRLVATKEEQNDGQITSGLHVGAHIDEFVIEELIGRGGVSEVYRACDTRTDTAVALKFLLPSRINDKQSGARLRNEAMHIMGLRHRNIVSVVDVRENELVGPYIVMELLDGKPLTAHLPLDQKRALEVCAHIAEALAYAHSKGMIHRDIKPSNVVMLVDGSVQLVDFGLAKIFAPENPQHMPLTRTTELVGTPLYMSPEQCFGQTVDARSDVYQLGCLLFQCLTGYPPFEGSNSFEAMYKHVSAQPDLAAMSEPIKDVLFKALDKNPEARFQSASEMGQCIQEAMQGRRSASRKLRKPKFSLAAVLLWVFVPLVVAGSVLPLVMFLPGTHVPEQMPSQLSLTPTQQEAYRLYRQGVDYKAKGWTEKSREALTKATKLDTSAVGFKALSFLRSHLPAHFQPPEAEQLNIKAYNLSYSGQQAEAERVWKECFALYPNFEWPYSNLGNLYLEQGQAQKAVPLLEKAIDINPYYTNALRNMSDTQLALGHRDLAIQFMQRAADSDPDEPGYKQALANLQRR